MSKSPVDELDALNDIKEWDFLEDTFIYGQNAQLLSDEEPFGAVDDVPFADTLDDQDTDSSQNVFISMLVSVDVHSSHREDSKIGNLPALFGKPFPSQYGPVTNAYEQEFGKLKLGGKTLHAIDIGRTPEKSSATCHTTSEVRHNEDDGLWIWKENKVLDECFITLEAYAQSSVTASFISVEDAWLAIQDFEDHFRSSSEIEKKIRGNVFELSSSRTTTIYCPKDAKFHHLYFIAAVKEGPLVVGRGYDLLLTLKELLSQHTKNTTSIAELSKQVEILSTQVASYGSSKIEIRDVKRKKVDNDSKLPDNETIVPGMSDHYHKILVINGRNQNGRNHKYVSTRCAGCLLICKKLNLNPPQIGMHYPVNHCNCPARLGGSILKRVAICRDCDQVGIWDHDLRQSRWDEHEAEIMEAMKKNAYFQKLLQAATTIV